MESMRGYPVCEAIPLSCASVHALWTCIFVVHGSPVANSNSCTAVSFFVSSCRTLRTYSIPVFASSAFVRENRIRSVFLLLSRSTTYARVAAVGICLEKVTPHSSLHAPSISRSRRHLNTLAM